MTQMQRQTSIEELSSKLKPILGSKIDELYFKYTLADSIDEKNEIAHILGALYKKHLGKLLDKKVLQGAFCIKLREYVLFRFFRQ